MALDSDLRIGSIVKYTYRSGRNVRFNPHTKDTDDIRINIVGEYTTDLNTPLRVVEGPIKYQEYLGANTIYWRAATPEQIFFWFPAGDVDVYEY